jgi:hypothetical protein
MKRFSLYDLTRQASERRRLDHHSGHHYYGKPETHHGLRVHAEAEEHPIFTQVDQELEVE